MAVVAQGVDFSGARPTAAALRAAGCSFVLRYARRVCPTCLAKNITAAEVAYWRAEGIDVGIVDEVGADRALAGFAAGAADARGAAAAVAAVGGQADGVIYMAVDFDALLLAALRARGYDLPVLAAREEVLESVRVPASVDLADHWAVRHVAAVDRVDATDLARQALGGQITGPVRQYLEGGVSALGYDRIGVYGSFDVVRYLLDNRVCRFGWQTYAWSGGLWHPGAHLQQYRNNVTLGGVAVDLNRATTNNYGQWGGAGDMPLNDADVRLLLAGFNQTRVGGAYQGQLDLFWDRGAQKLAQTLARPADVKAAIAPLLGDEAALVELVGARSAAVLAAVNDRASLILGVLAGLPTDTGGWTPEERHAFATELAAMVNGLEADAVIDALEARLERPAPAPPA